MTHTFLRFFWNIILRVLLKGYFRLKIVGKKNLPQNKSFVLVANHSSHLDALVLLACVPLKLINRTFSVAAKDYFFTSLWRSLLAVIFVNALPFDRIDKKKESLELCADILNVGEHILIMFPEGTRSTTEDIQPFKKGIGILTASTDRLVVPAFIKGAFAAWPKGSSFPHPTNVQIFIGQAMQFLHIPRTEEGFWLVAQETEHAIKQLQNNLMT